MSTTLTFYSDAEGNEYKFRADWRRCYFWRINPDGWTIAHVPSTYDEFCKLLENWFAGECSMKLLGTEFSDTDGKQ